MGWTERGEQVWAPFSQADKHCLDTISVSVCVCVYLCVCVRV